MATKEERLAEYEELFANRYAENDGEYQKHVANVTKRPPVVTDWLNTGYDRRRDDRGRGDRGWERHGGDRDRRDRYDRRDQNRDNRDRGYGGGRHDYRDRGPRDNRGKHQIQYKSSGYYEMYY